MHKQNGRDEHTVGTHDVTAKTWSGVCPEKYVTPVTKIAQDVQKARSRHAHAM